MTYHAGEYAITTVAMLANRALSSRTNGTAGASHGLSVIRSMESIGINTWQAIGLRENDVPLVRAFVLVPVEIIDQLIPVLDETPARRLGFR